MGQSKDLSVSRRGFLKGAIAAGGAAALYGCSKGNDGGEVIYSGSTSGGGTSAPSTADELADAKIFYASCVHNCGTGVRCVSKLHVVNGRIVRVTTDYSDNAYDGSRRGADNINDIQYNDAKSLTCARGHSFKYRVYHPGKLRYALKQTKKRGDLDGFIRIPVEQAMAELAKKYRATVKKYGSGSVLSIYASASTSGGTYAQCGNAISGITAPMGYRSAYSDYSYFQYHFGQPLTGHPGSQGAYYKTSNIGWQFPAIAGCVKNVVSWGANVLTTVNSAAWSYIRSFELLKKHGGKAWFIGPEFTDTGVVCHNEWVQLRNYTDTALIMGMLGEMLKNTFNADGSINSNTDLGKPYLDVDYLDTMVYGFFASPEYWVNTGDGEIYLTNPDPSGKQKNYSLSTGEVVTTQPATATFYCYSDPSTAVTTYYATAGENAGASPVTGFWRKTGESDTTSLPADVNNNAGWVLVEVKKTIDAYRHVEEVEPGKCLAAYIMGNDDRLTKALYSASNNYTAQKFAAGGRARAGLCSWTIKGTPANTAGSASSDFLYKKDFMVTKDAAWAEKICGVPAAKIKELAKMYCDPAQHPICNEWAGGVQKQFNGAINIWAIQALMCITKTFGLAGETFGGAWATTNSRGPVADTNADHFIDTPKGIGNAGVTPIADSDNCKISCKEWFNAIKIAFKEYLTPENGYTGEYIPNWDMNNRYITDDGGVKATVLLKKDAIGKAISVTKDGKTYYDYETDDNGEPVYAGLRMILNVGGGIPVNQHMNTNDSASTYRAIPSFHQWMEQEGADEADALCLAGFEIFMAPSARYMDYILPAVTSLEAPDTMSMGGHSKALYRPAVVQPLGEAKNGWRMAYEAYKAQSDLGEFTLAGRGSTAGLVGSHLKYVGQGGTPAKSYIPVEDYYEKEVGKVIGDSDSKFYGMTREQVYANQFTPARNNDEYISKGLPGSEIPYETKGTTSVDADSVTEGAARDAISRAGQIRKNLDEYLENPAAPFVFAFQNGVQNVFEASTYFADGWLNSYTCDEFVPGRPKAAGRFQVYNGMLPYDYEHLFSKYHGWLADKGGSVGQSNLDHEGDLKVYPIPMYFNFQDCFREIYNGFEGKDLSNGTNKWNKSWFSSNSGKLLTLSTTHDRFRSHSTHNENPFLRELNHRTEGTVKYQANNNVLHKPANDWKEYCIVPESAGVGDTPNFESPMISTAVYKKSKDTASWHEIWMNTEDAKSRGISDGDLCRVSNPIGTVRVIARVTDRIMKGTLNLHQGGWYDPNPEDGVDDGGCANTLMASQGSRMDNGNSQQFAYVTIEKETKFKFA